MGALCVLGRDRDFCAGELIERPRDGKVGIIPNDSTFTWGVVPAGCFVKDLGSFRENKKAVRKAFGNPEKFEIAIVVAGLEVEGGPAAEVGRVAAEINGDVPDVAGEDPDEFSLGMT